MVGGFWFFIVIFFPGRRNPLRVVDLVSLVEASYRYPRPAVDRKLHRCHHFSCALLPGRIFTPLFFSVLYG